MLCFVLFHFALINNRKKKITGPKASNLSMHSAKCRMSITIVYYTAPIPKSNQRSVQAQRGFALSVGCIILLSALKYYLIPQGCSPQAQLWEMDWKKRLEAKHTWLTLQEHAGHIGSALSPGSPKIKSLIGLNILKY